MTDLLSKLRSSFGADGDFSDADYEALEQAPTALREFFTNRVALYEDAFKDTKAVHRVRAMLASLRETYLKQYDETFRLQVAIGDKEVRTGDSKSPVLLTVFVVTRHCRLHVNVQGYDLSLIHI